MKFAAMSLAAIGLFALTACTPPADQSNSSKKPGDDKSTWSPVPLKTYTIALSQCNLGEPYRAQMNKDIEAAVKAHPEFKLVEKDAQNDSLKQASQLGEFVQDKVDLIIISPKEAQPLTEPIGKAIDAGIPVIILDRPIIGDKYTCFIGADNKLIGKAAGAWLAKKLGGKGSVVELEGLMTSIPAHDRHDGFMAGIAGTDVKVIKSAEMKWLEPDSRKEMESILTTTPHIDAVYGHNDPGAHGAYLAAQAAHREKEMIFIGVDGLPQEGQVYVKQGLLAATFQYPTGGAEAIDTALKILKKEKFDKNITLSSKFYTPDNVDKGGEPLP